MSPAPAQVGFARRDLAPALPDGRDFAAERVEAVAMFVGAPDGTPESLWIALDFMDFDLAMVNAVKAGVEAAAAIPRARVHVLTTHNHGADVKLDFQALAALAGEAADAARKAARPAVARGAQVAMPDGINYRRRLFIPEFDSTWTCFGGPDMRGRRSAAGFVENAIAEFQKGALVHVGWKPSDRKSPDFQPGDPHFFVMEFQDAETGAPLGAVARFAMHATMRSARDGSYYSSDYPWHIRRELENRLGGTAIFFNGPCGDLAPCFPWPDKTTGIEREYARRMADAGLAALGTRPFQPLQARSDSRAVSLPVRPEVLADRVDLPAEMPSADDLPRRKKWLERERLVTTLYFLQWKYRNGVPNARGFIDVDLGGLRLNEWLLLAFPGETFWATGEAVRQACGETVVTLTEHGRTAMYLAPGEEFRDGGYESICAVTAPPAEEILREHATAFAQAMLQPR